MADVPDWLLDLSGGALGLNKGAVLAADPYKAWADVNTRDLANERFGVQNRDIAALQAAKENPDLHFYGNAATALDTGNRLASSKGSSDIFNVDQALAMQKALADPNGAFQAEVRARGLTPNMPEYGRLAEQYIGQYNPQAGIAAEDLFKVPERQNRNTQDQLYTAYVQAYARMSDRNAIAARQPDGTFVIYGSQGETIPVNADQLANIVSFMKGGDPAAVIRQNLDTQRAIQVGNAAMVTALGNWAKNTLPKVATSADLTKALDSVRISRDRVVAGIDRQIESLKKGSDWGLKSKEEQQALLAPLEARKVEVDAQRERAIRALEEHATRIGIPRASQIPSGATSGGVPINPTGGSSLTTVFNPIAQALGIDPTAFSLSGGGDRANYPTPRSAAGVGPQSSADMPDFSTVADLYGTGGMGQGGTPVDWQAYLDFVTRGGGQPQVNPAMAYQPNSIDAFVQNLTRRGG